ncbi:hypothetical protein FPANT_1649 [Fusarium pseudoanthophilum]|uniref:Uncharacterized protein n=1 Tax=Fusarium pseudoanthophilum TaxID=48495 RepID=A0A8H5PRK1_9HYPO|nr:hypothetical protein FPANT_1649 [Fusarium pseudoanthophilum]
MEYVTDDRALKVLSHFKKAKITLVEWETSLLRRLGYPLASKEDLLFLVPDEQMKAARHIVEENGLQDDHRPPGYMAEHARKGFRYVFGQSSHKFILVPISWTGIQRKELVPVDSATLPCPLWTVPMPALCAAYLRILTEEETGHMVRAMGNADLSGIVAYSMFDMSYEGDYMPTPEDLEHLDAAEKERMAEKDALEMENALSSIKQWQFTEETEWARDMMLHAFSQRTTPRISTPGIGFISSFYIIAVTMASHVTTMKEAARVFSRILTEHNIEHAFIGGFAVKMLDSQRETHDIDVEISVAALGDPELRGGLVQLLQEADKRFVVSNLKLFFCPNERWDLRVPIETLASGALGLPRRFSILRPGNGSIPILHPSVLILTKMKRAHHYIGSTRPQSMNKLRSDTFDILHLLHWLQDHDKKIDFINYDSAAPERLYDAVRNMRAHWVSKGEETTVQLLDDVLEENDKAIVMNN